MTSKRTPVKPDHAFVWIWLPGATTPVVAGRLSRIEDTLRFNYGRSYLSRPDAIPIYEPELPLRQGELPLLSGLAMPGCLRDAAPDAWGRRVIFNRLLGAKGRTAPVDETDELTYMLESGSNRIGALDFQASATAYVPRRAQSADLAELQAASAQVEAGVPIDPELSAALLHGTSLGGARPKAMIDDGGCGQIAKFSSSTDVMNIVKGEFVAMRLAAVVGLDVAPVSLARVAGKDVLMIARFDRDRRDDGVTRRAMVSALTLFGFDEMMARYASYEQLAEIIRHRFVEPKATLRELYARLVFNVLCGNTDDHARNHAAFWDGAHLKLTPAYDICPQPRSGGEATQAMLIKGDDRRALLALCVDAAPAFHLKTDEARRLIQAQIKTIVATWPKIAEEAQLSEVERQGFWRRQFLNPYAFQGASQEFIDAARGAEG